MPLPRLFASEKSIPSAVKWSPPDPDDGYMRLFTSLVVDEIGEAGLTLSAGTYVHHPERHVTFELAVSAISGHRRIRLARVDWRDLKDGHSNKRHACGGIERRTAATHVHPFELNWTEATRKMKRGKLPCAVSVSEDLQSFEELRSYVGRTFRINNIDLVPPPEWAYDLFR